MDGQQLANSLHGLGRLSMLVGPSLNYTNQQGLLASAAFRSVNMTEQEIGNTIWGLGQIGVQFSSANRSALDKLYGSIVNLENSLQRQAIVAILQGLSCSGGLTWSGLNKHLREVLLLNIERSMASSSSCSEDAKFASNVINCLGKFRAQWNNGDDLSDGFKAILLRKLELFKVGGEKEQAGGIVSLATNGFCRMGVSWEQICDVFTFDSNGKTEMMNRTIFAESVDLMSTNELANILWSLGMRRTKWTEICGGVGGAVLGRFISIGNDMSAYEFTWSMWALARMELRWCEDFGKDQCSKIMQIAADVVDTSLPEQEIGVLLWALVKLQAPPQEFSRSLKQLFVDNIEYILIAKNR